MYSAYVAPVGALDVGHRYGLPQLPDSDVILHSTVTDPVSQKALKMLIAAFQSRYASLSAGGTRKNRPLIHSQKRNQADIGRFTGPVRIDLSDGFVTGLHSP